MSLHLLFGKTCVQGLSTLHQILALDEQKGVVMTTKQYFFYGFIIIFVVTFLTCVFDNAVRASDEENTMYIISVDSILYASPNICWDKTGIFMGKNMKCTLGEPKNWSMYFPYYNIDYLKARPMTKEELEEMNKSDGNLTPLKSIN